MKFRPTPDMYALAVFAAALIAEGLLPISFLPAASWESLHSWLGGALVLGGFGLEAAAGAALSRTGTTTRPFEAPTALVTSGPFAWSRHPLYCGMLLILLGLAVALSVEWGIILAPVLWLALDRLVVPAEEQALASAFPVQWDAYARRTPRWLGVVSSAA